jgi:hypothetical protein
LLVGELEIHPFTIPAKGYPEILPIAQAGINRRSERWQRRRD